LDKHCHYLDKQSVRAFGRVSKTTPRVEGVGIRREVMCGSQEDLM